MAARQALGRLTSRPPAGSAADSAALVAAATAAGVHDPRVLRAMRRVPRGWFVPSASAHLADVDEPVPIPHGQVTTQPSLVAVMVQALELAGGEAVLEVGTGYGYQTALLAALARRVWSVEWWADLAAAASANLVGLGVRNAEVVVGDGGRGLAEHAPYDAVVVAAAAPRVPPPLVDQLAEGGRLVQPIGPGGLEDVRVFVKHGAALGPGRLLVPARFVPLVGELGAGR